MSTSTTPPTASLKAYVQGDWVGSTRINDIGFKSDPTVVGGYTAFLDRLAEAGIENTATWHFEACGVVQKKRPQPDDGKANHTDVVRNTRQIRGADAVVTRLVRADPTSRHWGSLSNMAYAVGQGRPVYLIATDDCVIWQSHFVWHPLIHRFTGKTLVEAEDAFFASPVFAVAD